jgi:hypothetical protein
METAVISDALADQIGVRRVVAGVFTTYTFEPEFFELDVVPLLLGEGVPYSSDERVKEFQVRERLRETGVALEVFYDLPVNRDRLDRSPAMEYLCHGVVHAGGAFHGKLILLLLHDEELDQECLLVGAGSCNLSRSGWWHNVECLHFETVWPGEVFRGFRDRLEEDVEFLRQCRPSFTDVNQSALDRVGNFLDSCRASQVAEPVHYYGISQIDFRKPFPDFLRAKKRPLARYQNWQLEIISPFFADDPTNKEHEAFFDLGVEAITVLLPIDDEGRARCSDTYFRHLEKLDGIEWGDWSPKLSKSLGRDSDYFRNLHAKVYHFYNGKQSFVFIGSINFTHKAFYDNAEAGFLVKLPKPVPLLSALPKSRRPDEFIDPEDAVPGEGENETRELPELHLSYDWVNKTLCGQTGKRMEFVIEILNQGGSTVVSGWNVAYKESAYDGDVSDLESLLKNGSLVRVSGHNHKTGEPFEPHQVMLQQTGWSHKPMELPVLTTEQILAIYAGMDEERRSLMLVNAIVRKLVLADEGGELSIDYSEGVSDQFFCEYAEIFHAFRTLRNTLRKLVENEDWTRVDYYLTGTGVDSLPSLLGLATDPDKSEVSSVTRYLLMLCAKELLEDARFIKRPQVKDALKIIEQDIRKLEAPGGLVLADDDGGRRKKFFRWFRQEFQRQLGTNA